MFVLHLLHSVSLPSVIISFKTKQQRQFRRVKKVPVRHREPTLMNVGFHTLNVTLTWLTAASGMEQVNDAHSRFSQLCRTNQTEVIRLEDSWRGVSWRKAEFMAKTHLPEAGLSAKWDSKIIDINQLWVLSQRCPLTLCSKCCEIFKCEYVGCNISLSNFEISNRTSARWFFVLNDVR